MCILKLYVVESKSIVYKFVPLAESGKLVKSDGGKNDNLSKISEKVCLYSLNSCKF